MMDLEIDGSMGEGGGQVLRTALTLSMCLQRSIAVVNIRAGRSKPGLLRQHLAAIRASQEICGAQVEGAELGATEIQFAPQPIQAGSYEFRIGSAGSTTLLLQTVLPALALLDKPSQVVVHGGTHNGMAPSVDFMELAFLPVLARMGIRVESKLHQHGFYPNGGGHWAVDIHPWAESNVLSLMERGDSISRQAVVTSSNLQSHIAQRELDRVAKKLQWSADELVIREVVAPGPGNIVSLRCQYASITEVFEATGSMGVSAERVAGRVIRDAKRYLQAEHAVGEYLADQLLLPMVLGAGGEFTTGALSEHCRTNMALISQMLDADKFDVYESVVDDNPHTIVRIPRGLALNC